MAEFIMLVGLPGSGKSTVAKVIYSADSTEIVSSDSIREELYGSEEIQTDPARVFEIARNRVIDALNSGRHAVLDATNLIAKKRISFIQDVKARVSVPFSCRAVVMCPPIEVCIDRDAKRNRVVGEDVVRRMVKTFQYPQPFEGFDRIEKVYDTYGSTYAEHYLLLNYAGLFRFMWEKARHFDQNTPYHKYSLYDHCVKVAAQFESDDPRHFAGYVHDIGKLYTQTTDENGVSHYYNHENVGAYMLATLTSFNCDMPFNDIIFFVNYHMHIRDIIKSEKAVKKYKQLWGEERFNKLVEFMEADNKASGREV